MRDPADPTPKGQLKQELDGFCEGEKLIYPSDIRILERPRPVGVWELKTPDLRLFGWFVEKDVMVLHVGRDATWLKAVSSRYEDAVQEVVAFRSSLVQLLPVFIEAIGTSHVVSNRVR